MRKTLIGIGIFFLVLIGGSLAFYFSIHSSSAKEFNNKYIVVRKGDNFKKIYSELGLKYGLADKMYLKLTGEASKIKTGSYKFDGKVSKAEIINKITNGKNKQHQT